MMKLLFFIHLLLIPFVCGAAKYASWYGEECEGNQTANGETFTRSAFTCATWEHPFNSVLRVGYGGKFVLARVNDRGPNRRFKNRILDLSEASFAALANPKRGLIPVTIERVR